MKNSKGVSLIALIITIIVIIILAAIVMNASTSTVGNAQYARFAQEFGEYADQVALDAANIKSNTGIKGQIINNAQMYYMTANGFSRVESGDLWGIAKRTMPVGYVLTDQGADVKYPYVLQHILSIGDETADNTVTYGAERKSGDRQVAYVIRDSSITISSQYKDTDDLKGSAAREFYGDSNGTEYHFITSDGQVFTLPGYPVQQTDGSIEYHIDSKNGHYYVVAGNSGKTPTPSAHQTNVNGDVVVATRPIQASYLKSVHGIDQDGKALNTAVATNSRSTTGNGTELK